MSRPAVVQPMPDALASPVPGDHESTAGRDRPARDPGAVALAACLVVITAGAVGLALAGSWLADANGAVAIATIIGGACLVLVSGLRRRWLAAGFFLDAGSFGLLLASATPSPSTGRPSTSRWPATSCT